MENTDTTLLEMQQQLKQLKEKLDSQKIVNDRLLQKSCNNSLNRLRSKSNLPILFGIAAILMSASFVNLGMSWPFILFTDVMMLVCIVATILTNQHIPSMDQDLVTAAEGIRKYKKIHAEWIKFALPVLAVWFGLFIWEAVQNVGLTGTPFYAFLAGITVGIALGLVLGFKLRREQLNAADELLAQLTELKKSE
jgi:hypothetical protein